jgi:transposase
MEVTALVTIEVRTQFSASSRRSTCSGGGQFWPGLAGNRELLRLRLNGYLISGPIYGEVAMRDVELYWRLLGDRGALGGAERGSVGGRAEGRRGGRPRQGGALALPRCATELSVYDHAEERAWRHLDSCRFITWLHARAPRVSCPAHGVRQVLLPWAEPHAHFTALFERLAIDLLKETDITGACRILRISWDEGWHLMERAVARGMARKERRVPTLVGVDEKAAAKGHRYMTLVCDLERATVEYIAEERKQASLDGYFEALSEDERGQIKAVAMDMWEPYVNSVCAHLPDAEEKIVFDRFHIMKHMVEAVDTVRKREHRALQAEGLDLLTGSKYLWLYSQENLPERHRERFVALKATNLKTGRAWAIKESLRALWHYRRLGWARRFHKQWYFWATHSRACPGHRRGPHHQPPPERSAQLLLDRADHQRRRRRPQLQDPDDREDGLRLPQPGALQDRNLLPLWDLQLYPDRPLTHGNPG